MATLDLDVKDLAWLAGLFEGEGCISLRWRDRGGGLRPDVFLVIHSTDRDVIEKVAGLWNTRVRYLGINRRSHARKPSYATRMGNRDKVISFLEQIYDMMGKRRRAKIDEVMAAFDAVPAKWGVVTYR